MRYLAIFAAIWGGVLLAAGALVWAVDPLQVYHRAWFPPELGEERYQNPGLARNYDYAAVMVGPSYSQNFSPRELTRELGLKTLKLSISGASAHEEFQTVRLALRTGKPRLVLWNIDHGAFSGGAERVHERAFFPAYLYDQNLWNDTAYLLNRDVVLQSIRLFRRHCCTRRELDDAFLEKMNTWGPRDYTFSRERMLMDWQRLACTGGDAMRARPDEMVGSARLNLEPLLREYAGTRFILFFPPYSMPGLKFLAHHQPENYAEFLALKRYVYALGDLPNVSVFDFQDDFEVVTNLDLYKDLWHYLPEVNSRMTRAFASGAGRVAPDDRERRMRRLAKAVEEYPLPLTAWCAQAGAGAQKPTP